MKKLAITAVALMMLGGFASAQTVPTILSGEATAHVRVEVVANIAVGVLTPDVNVGQVAYGVFQAQITFRIDANVETVKIQIVATDLYKGDDPASAFKIPVKTGAAGDGALVQPTNGNAKGGHSNLLAWLAGEVILNGMNGVQSEAVDYESGQQGHFSQNVLVTVKYDQKDAELPKGEYSGWVKLIATIQP